MILAGDIGGAVRVRGGRVPPRSPRVSGSPVRPECRPLLASIDREALPFASALVAVDRPAEEFLRVPGKLLLVGRGLAMGDLDGDGRVDVVFNPIAHDAVVMRNEVRGGRSLELLPLPGADRRTVLGTVVTVTTAATGERAGRTARKEFTVVPSYAGGSWTPLHFGLGPSPSARVTVRWPDGTVQELGDVAAGAWKLPRGGTPAPLRARPGRP